MKKNNQIFLGQLLDEAIHPIVSRENIIKGRIIKMNLFASDGLHIKSNEDFHPKRFVIIGFTPNGNAIAVNLINSKFNSLTSDFASCQIKLNESDYQMTLTHDSWLDCSTIFEFDINRILKEGHDHGSLNDKDYKKVFDLLKETEVISVEDKKYYGLL